MRRLSPSPWLMQSLICLESLYTPRCLSSNLRWHTYAWCIRYPNTISLSRIRFSPLLIWRPRCIDFLHVNRRFSPSFSRVLDTFSPNDPCCHIQNTVACSVLVYLSVCLAVGSCCTDYRRIAHFYRLLTHWLAGFSARPEFFR